MRYSPLFLFLALFFTFNLSYVAHAKANCPAVSISKSEFIRQSCSAIGYGNNGGENCLEKVFKLRAKDTGMQVAAAMNCGFTDEAQVIEGLAREMLPFTKRINSCLGIQMEEEMLFNKGYTEGKQRLAGKNCSKALEGKLRKRLPQLIDFGYAQLNDVKSIFYKTSGSAFLE